MIDKIKSLIFMSKAKFAALTLATVGGVLSASHAFAAVDPDVASTTQQLVSTMKENVTGVITTNINQIVVVGVIIFSLTFVWKLTRRFMK
jgi:hypothetical protein